MMHLSSTVALVSSLLLLVSSVGAASPWQVLYVLSHEMLSSGYTVSNSSIAFSLDRGSTPTNCSASWIQSPTPAVPKQWIKCDDPLLRWRIGAFNDASNFALEVVELAPVISNGKTKSIGITRANITLSQGSGLSCSSNARATGTQCVLSNPPLTLATALSSFTPSPLPIVYSLSRSDGPQGGVIPCTGAWTFYIYDPNVSLLGPRTLGRGTQYQWETHCDTTWACSGSDNSINTWANCAAPSFQFLKTIPMGGDPISNFVMSIKHSFPLMMATSIRGSNAQDTQLTDPEEASGLQVVLILEDTTWKNGKTLTPIMSGGIDQTGNCALGCEFSGQNVNVKVADLEII